MPEYRDPNGRIWRLPSKREVELRASSAGLPVPDRETIDRALEEWARRFADAILLPIELVRGVLEKLPAAIVIGGVVYYLVTRDDPRSNRRR